MGIWRRRENKDAEEQKEPQAAENSALVLFLSENLSEREPEMERIHVTVRARPLSAADAKTSPWRISDNSIFIPNHHTKFEFGMFLLIFLLYDYVFFPQNFHPRSFSYFFWLPILLSFWFIDQIFGEDCKTFEVYQARTKEIVASAVRGFNGIFSGNCWF